MKYSDQIVEEVLLQTAITDESDKLRSNLICYREYWRQCDPDYYEQNYEQFKKIYGTVVGKLYKGFYGASSTEIVKVLRSNNIKVPNSKLMYLMNERHLKHLHFMLRRINKYFNDNLNCEPNQLIAASVSISEESLETFYDNMKEMNDKNGTDVKKATPFEDLITNIPLEYLKPVENGNAGNTRHRKISQ